MIEVKLEQFGGPLDLLLSLLKKQKLEITEISLVQVTEQYLAAVKELEKEQVTYLLEFLQVASELLLLKSRALMPELVQAEDEEGDVAALEARLKLLEKFQSAGRRLGVRMSAGGRSYRRERLVVKRVRKPVRFDVADLAVAMERVVRRHQVAVPALEKDKIVLARVSVKEKLVEIEMALEKLSRVKFSGSVDMTSDVDVVAGFLAVLELVKQCRVDVVQGRAFGEIELERVGGVAEAVKRMRSGAVEREILITKPKENEQESGATAVITAS